MTRSEFDRWLNDYVGKFPSTGIWLAELGEHVESAQRGLWADILADVSLAEGKRATLAMAKGEYSPVGSFNADREQTALKVRDVVRQMRREAAAESEQPDPDEDYSGRPGLRNANGERPRGVLDAYIKGKAAGKSTEQMAREIFGPPPSPDQVPRYRCPGCRDKGWRTVWHYSSMAAWRSGLIAATPPDGPWLNHHTMIVPCNCRAGETRCMTAEEEHNGKRSRSPKPRLSSRFDIEKYCPVGPGGVTDAGEIAEFCSWCANYFQERERERLARLETEESRFV